MTLTSAIMTLYICIRWMPRLKTRSVLLFIIQLRKISDPFVVLNCIHLDSMESMFVVLQAFSNKSQMVLSSNCLKKYALLSTLSTSQMTQKFGMLIPVKQLWRIFHGHCSTTMLFLMLWKDGMINILIESISSCRHTTFSVCIFSLYN